LVGLRIDADHDLALLVVDEHVHVAAVGRGRREDLASDAKRGPFEMRVLGRLRQLERQPPYVCDLHDQLRSRVGTRRHSTPAACARQSALGAARAPPSAELVAARVRELKAPPTGERERLAYDLAAGRAHGLE